METPYLDNLQSPLQPLGDHLEYQTYETFERDPVKYKNYGEAVELALEDGMEEGKFGHLSSTKTSLGELKRRHDVHNILVGDEKTMVEVDIYEVTIMVVGAGRGPLVREAVSAVSRVSSSMMSALNSGRRKAFHAKIIAIEKNPSAVLYLNSLKQTDPSWNGGREDDYYTNSDHPADSSDGKIAMPGTSDVTVIGCDMREATSHPMLKRMIENNSKHGADIVVSELLGSFGDNELSPECLDGVQQCGILKNDCVSIPQSYTSYIAPVSSARLFSEAKSQSCHPLNSNEGFASPSVGMQRALETPYVVRSHAASQTHEEQECWIYEHPHPCCKKEADAMDTTPAASNSNLSSKAVENVDNDRTAHLSFQHNPTGSVGSGCGYGPLDQELTSMASSEEAGSNKNADATAATIHGFLGTFHSVLYESPKKIAEKKKKKNGGNEERSSVISIAPHSFSVGMFSWFPLYFPLKESLRVPPGSTLNCSIWRRSDDKRVWYEWCAEVVAEEGAVVWGTSSIHNPGGRSYHVKK